MGRLLWFNSFFIFYLWDSNLTQFISQPSLLIEGNILDVVFTSFDMISVTPRPEVITQLPFNLQSDRYLITLKIFSDTINSRRSTRGFITYDYFKADWDSILALINN